MASSANSINTLAISTAGPVTLTSTAGGVTARGIDTSGGALTATGSGLINLSSAAGDAIQNGGRRGNAQVHRQ